MGRPQRQLKPRSIGAFCCSHTSAPDDGELVLPVPADAPPIPDAHFKLGRPTQRWQYCDPTGAVLFHMLRFDKSGGGKEFCPLTLWRDAQGLGWRWKSVPAPRPLYGLDALAAGPDAAVVLCEGEKSADAAAGFSRSRWP
jgi:putative DNA primase/helicase